jgi:hypothetical protein
MALRRFDIQDHGKHGRARNQDHMSFRVFGLFRDCSSSSESDSELWLLEKSIS